MDFDRARSPQQGYQQQGYQQQRQQPRQPQQVNMSQAPMPPSNDVYDTDIPF
jgi:hypothetical protein